MRGRRRVPFRATPEQTQDAFAPPAEFRDRQIRLPWPRFAWSAVALCWWEVGKKGRAKLCGERPFKAAYFPIWEAREMTSIVSPLPSLPPGSMSLQTLVDRVGPLDDAAALAELRLLLPESTASKLGVVLRDVSLLLQVWVISPIIILHALSRALHAPAPPREGERLRH